MSFFTPEDKYRLMRHLGLCPEMGDRLSAAMTLAESQSEFLVNQIKQDLDTLDALEKTWQAETGSVNFALIQVDVVRFAEDKRVSGILLQIHTLVRKIGVAIGIVPDLTIIEGLLGGMGLNSPNSSITIAKVRN